MFARVNSTQTATDKLAGLVKFSEEQLPAAREAPGFKGFYLLAHRQSGKVVSISLWDSDEDLRQFEARGAQLRKEASSELGIGPTPMDIYEVVLQVSPATGSAPAAGSPRHGPLCSASVPASHCRTMSKDQPNEHTD